jgi:hypothetical protein
MRADNTRHLRQAARDRHESTVARAEQALRQLDRTGQPVTFRSVAAAAGVSRAWLYRQPDLRVMIERLRAEQASSTGPQLPAAQRTSDESRHRRIQALHDDNTRLRAQNAQLREQVARLLGERRANAVTRPS